MLLWPTKKGMDGIASFNPTKTGWIIIFSSSLCLAIFSLWCFLNNLNDVIGFGLLVFVGIFSVCGGIDAINEKVTIGGSSGSSFWSFYRSDKRSKGKKAVVRGYMGIFVGIFLIIGNLLLILLMILNR